MSKDIPTALDRLAEAIEMTWPHNEESEKASVELAHYLYEDKIGVALQKCFRTPNCDNTSADTVNVVDGMFAIAEAINNLAIAVNRLSVEPETIRKGKS